MFFGLFDYLLENSFSQQGWYCIAYLLLDVHKRTLKDEGIWKTLKSCGLSH
jgi:hypothetical protein